MQISPLQQLLQMTLTGKLHDTMSQSAPVHLSPQTSDNRLIISNSPTSSDDDLLIRQLNDLGDHTPEKKINPKETSRHTSQKPLKESYPQGTLTLMMEEAQSKKSLKKNRKLQHSNEHLQLPTYVSSPSLPSNFPSMDTTHGIVNLAQHTKSSNQTKNKRFRPISASSEAKKKLKASEKLLIEKT